MDAEPSVPPGFRFHPTEEELVGYYLKRKIDSLKIDLDVIADIDLYRMEPWDIEDRCRLGYEEQNEWYFFSHKDRKYPTGTRTNRATAAGFWKATGRDKAVLSKDNIIGMRKTLVFYKGRAPNGCKTDWIMHEYRLQSSELAPPSQEEGWVVCRAFKKPSPNHKQGFDAWNNGYYFRNNGNFRPTTTPLHDHTVINPSSDQALHHSTREIASICQFPYASPQPLVSSHISARFDHSQFNELPQLDSPTVSTSLATTNEGHDHEKSTILRANNQFDDWGNLENIFDSKLIQPTSVLPYDPSTPLNLCNDELDAHGQISHFLGCFPDL